MELNAVVSARPGHSPIIKNLIPGLTERGKIKIGRKGAMRNGQNGQWQLPEKLDHFLVTTLERGNDNNFIVDSEIHKLLGGNEPKRIPVNLLFDDIGLNFQCRYSCYHGKTLFCSGDGEAAFQQESATKPARVQVQCPCYRQDPTWNGDNNDGKGKCKINGTLSVLIQGAEAVGGVWKFRTTGYNSTVGILSSLTLIKSLTGGMLAGIPLVMTIQPKVTTNPLDGKSQTVYVVGVEYAGSISSLQKNTLALAQGNAEFRARMAYVETEARKMISCDSHLVDEAGDITEEFFPDKPIAPQLAEPTAAAVVPVQVQAPSAQPPVTPAPTPAATEPAAPVTRKRGRPAATPPAAVPPALAPAAPAAPAAAPAPQKPPATESPALAETPGDAEFAIFD